MTPEHRAAIDAANAHIASTKPLLAAALVEHRQMALIVKGHEVALQMLREDGAPGQQIRAAQARLNGLRTKLGRAANRVRMAGGGA